jgi:DNA-binding GntR family transcriptional regulator
MSSRAAGEWSSGPLPSNRSLQQTYEVGEYVVTHAIRHLEADGIVFTVSRRASTSGAPASLIIVTW